jgi:hypothetical protein
MKSITHLSLALIMFSLFSISYLVTSVSAQDTSGKHAGTDSATPNLGSGISDWVKGGLKALGIGNGPTEPAPASDSTSDARIDPGMAKGAAPQQHKVGQERSDPAMGGKGTPTMHDDQNTGMKAPHQSPR